MTFVIGSPSVAAYTTSTTYDNNNGYIQWNGTAAQGVAANVSAIGAQLDLYIASWSTGLQSIKACLYENDTIISSVIVPRSVGTGYVSIEMPAVQITAGTQRYRMGFYLQASGGINLFTKTGGLNRYEAYTGNYTTPATTLPAGLYVAATEFYWAVETAPQYQIGTIDTDDNVEVGQTITLNTVGFTGQPVATTNDSRVTVTVTGGSNNVWTATVVNRVEGVLFPALPTSQITLTLTNGSEVATRKFTLTKKSTEALVTFSGVNILDRSYLSYHLTTLGFDVEGADFYYTVPTGYMEDLLVLPTGGIDVTGFGDFNAWIRPIAPAGMAGKVYALVITVPEFGEIITVDLTGLAPNSTTPRYDGAYRLGNRP